MRLALLVTVLALSVGGVSGLAFTPHSHAANMTASCYPIAFTPFISNHLGQGYGQVGCDSGAPSWDYTVKLVNHAGSTLTQTSGGPVTGSGGPTTQQIGCTGAVVHTFLYINVGGTGKSDTSGEVQC